MLTYSEVSQLAYTTDRMAPNIPKIDVTVMKTTNNLSLTVFIPMSFL